MNCPRCAQPNPAGAAFCMRCGSPLAAPPAPASFQPYAPVEPKKNGWVPWAVGAGLLLAALVGLTASGILRLPGANPPKALQVAATNPGPALTVQEKVQPTLPQTREAPVTMPADIRAWLEHLRETERRRKDLATEQISGLLVTMTKLQVSGGMDALRSLLGDEGDGSAPAPPIEGIKMDAAKIRGEWQQLAAFFESVPPPAECVPIRDQYNQTLYQTAGMITDILAAVENASADPQAAVSALQRMKGTSDEAIGRPAGETDRLVEAICAKYNTPKWFEIERDFGAGMGSLGIGR